MAVFGSPLPPDVAEAFDELGESQRGRPESAMERAQSVLGGSSLSYLIERIGDLIHRMTEGFTQRYAGYPFAKEKIDYPLRMLRELSRDESGLPIREIFFYQMARKAKSENMPLPEYMALVKDALAAYVAAHRELRVYNRAQYHARAAAIAIGSMLPHRAMSHLKVLETFIADPLLWQEKTHEFHRNPDGSLKTF